MQEDNGERGRGASGRQARRHNRYTYLYGITHRDTFAVLKPTAAGTEMQHLCAARRMHCCVTAIHDGLVQRTDNLKVQFIQFIRDLPWSVIMSCWNQFVVLRTPIVLDKHTNDSLFRTDITNEGA
jgi:hypothetical protein